MFGVNGYFSFIMITLEQRSEPISKIIPVASVICKGLIEPRISFVQEIIIPISYYFISKMRVFFLYKFNV